MVCLSVNWKNNDFWWNWCTFSYALFSCKYKIAIHIQQVFATMPWFLSGKRKMIRLTSFLGIIGRSYHKAKINTICQLPRISTCFSLAANLSHLLTTTHFSSSKFQARNTAQKIPSILHCLSLSYINYSSNIGYNGRVVNKWSGNWKWCVFALRYAHKIQTYF